MKNYLSVIKSLGTNTNSHFINPRIFKSTGFPFNNNSMLITYKVVDGTEPLLSKVSSVVKFIQSELYNPIGKVTKSTKGLNNFIRMDSALDNSIRHITKKIRLYTVTPSTVIVDDLGYLELAYKFKGRFAEHEEMFSILKTLAYDSNELISTRIPYVLIDVPEALPKLRDIETGIKLTQEKLYRKFNYTTLPIIYLFGILSKEHHLSSPLNLMHKETNILLRFKNSLILLRKDKLDALVNKDVEATTKYVGDKRARQMLYVSILKLMVTEPVDISVEASDYYLKAFDKEVEIEEPEDINKLIGALELYREEPEPVDEDETEVVDIKVEKLTVIEQAKRALNLKKKTGSISAANEKELLEYLDKQEKDKVIEKLTIPKENLIVSRHTTAIPEVEISIDDSMRVNTINAFDTKYINEVYEKDTKKAIYSLSSGGNIITIDDINENTDFMSSTKEYTVSIKPLGGRKVKRKIIMPQLNQEGTFKYAGNDYNTSKQKRDFPIKKIQYNRVALNSYYGKVFIDKASLKKSDIGYKVNNHLMKLAEDGQVSLLISGSVEVFDIKLPLQYGYLSRYTKSFNKGGLSYSFDYNNIETKFPKWKDKKIPFAKNKTFILSIDNENMVYKHTNGKVEPLNADLFSYIGLDLRNLPVEFSTVFIQGKRVPLVIILMYYYGIDKMMKNLKIKAKITLGNSRVTLESNEYKIKFLDRTLVLNRNDKEATLIMGGFVEIKDIVKNIEFNTLKDIDGVVSLAQDLGYNTRLIKEFMFLDEYYVDHMTAEVLELKKEPTTFRGLLIRANELLVTDFKNHPRSLSGFLITGNERINGMLYYTMVNALKEYGNSNGRAQININPYSVITELQADASTELTDKLNPFTIIKKKEMVSPLGFGGRSKETMSKETRAHDASEVGVISEAGKDSSDIGIVNGLSYGADLNNIRGIAGESDPKDRITPGGIFSTPIMLQPAADLDDIKRMIFTGVQSSHLVPIVGQSVIPFRTGVEYYIGSKVGESFCTVTEHPGVVKQVTNKEVVVEQDTPDGKVTKKFRLYSRTTKEESGSTYTHNFVTSLRKGDKLKTGYVVTYVDEFFEPDLLYPERIVYKSGVLINTMLVNKQSTDEDSCLLSEDATDKLKTKPTTVISKVIKSNTEIFNLINIGDKTDLETKLFTMMVQGEDLETLGVSDESIEILKEQRNASPLAKIKGKVVNIQIVYNDEDENLTKSLLAYVRKYEKLYQEKVGKKISTKVTNGYSVKGKKLEAGNVEIKIYIEYVAKATPGNKLIFANQLKAEVSGVFDNKTRTERGEKVDALFDRPSIGARIVISPDLIGTTIKILKEETINIVDEYFS